MGQAPFIHLHVHSDFSMLDGLGKPVAYVERAKALGMPALALTDHGNMSGAYEFYMKCKEMGIRPLLGCEFYFEPEGGEQAKLDKNSERFHIVLLAKNEAGFRTIIELQTEAHRNFYYKPLLDRHILEALGDEADNIHCLSGCAASILSKKLMGEEPGSATEEMMWWREIFNVGNYHLELQHHGTAFDRKLNSRLMTMGRKYKLPWVITNDPHYVYKEEEECHDALLAIQTAADIDDPDRFSFDGSGYHLKSRAEMAHTFRNYGNEIWVPGCRETAKIAKSCDVKVPEWDTKSWHIPKFNRVPEGRTSIEMLRGLTYKAMREWGFDEDERYVERVEYELGEIASVEGFADFLLITRWIIQNAVRKGIRVGAGRGSTAGCLVAYFIGVHKCDPIRYKLLFERFLNPARPKMPDIDTDFMQSRRQEVLEDIAAEYGADNVLPVAAFQTMKVRGAFRRLATSMGMPFKDLKKYTDMMNDAWGRDDDDDDEEQEDHIRVEHLPRELVEGYPELVEFIEGMIGTKSAISRHPAGVIIFDPEDSIKSCVPQMWVVSSKRMAAQFDLKSAEKMGLMKQDILGLRTLDTIEAAVNLIAEQTGEEFDPDDWVPDEEEGDSQVYKMMAEGHCAGIFQLEGGTMFSGIQKIKPKRFEDVVVCTSIYRKGPMLAGAPDRYIANKKANKVKVLHPALEPILEDSWGEMAYQEQLMQIAAEVAGFDQGGVADLLAAVRFKDEKMMTPLKDQFIRGCRKVSNIRGETAEKIWHQLEVQASYLFNRSHAAAYSLTTYQTARLKCWWPLQYLTALMQTVPPKNDADKRKRQTYLAEATDFGYRILPPDINESDAKMSCGEDEEGHWMRFGLIDVKGIGMPTAEKILAKREEAGGFFETVDDAKKVLPDGQFSKLDIAGCFEDIGGSERDYRALEEIIGWQFEDVMAPIRQKYGSKVKLPGRGDSRVRLMGELIEVNRKKTKTNKPYMTWRIRWTPSEIFTITLWEDVDSLWDIPKGSIVLVEGKFNQEFRNVSVGDTEQVRVIRYAKTKKEAA